MAQKEIETPVNEVAEVSEESKTTDEYVDHAPLFYDGKTYKDPVSVIINGVKYSVPRGKPLKLPKVVAEVLDQSMAQDAYASQVDAKMQTEQVVQM